MKLVLFAVLSFTALFTLQLHDSLKYKKPVSTFTVTTSDSTINNMIGGISFNDISFYGKQNPVCIDVSKDPFKTTVQNGHFSFGEYGTGGNANWYHVIVGQKNMTEGPGMGYNPRQPADCNIQQGKLCKNYLLYGKPYDLYLSYDSLCSLVGTNSVIIANIYQGTLDELDEQINRSRRKPGKLIYIQFGAEQVTHYKDFWNGNGKNYTDKVNAWIAAITSKYPKNKFMFILDTAQRDGGGSSEKWNKELFENAMGFDATRDYAHLFRWVQFNGNISHDTAQVTNAVNVDLVNFLSGRQYPLYIGQLSASDSAYNPATTKGIFLTVQFYARAYKKIVEAKRDGTSNVIGCSVVSLNLFIDPSGAGNLDYKFLSVTNNIFSGKKGFILSGSSLGNGIDWFGVYYKGVYKLVIQNRSGIDYTLPTAINLDGRAASWTATKSIGEFCTGFYSNASTAYTPTATIKGFSINYFELQ